MEGVVIRLLEFWGENPAREGLKETPARFLKGMSEMLSGYRTDPTAHLKKHFDISDVEASRYDQVIISKDIPFVSFCEHHLMPFFGQVHIGYLPDPEHGRVVGLSKLARCVEGYSQRLQVQERLTRQIHDAINDVMKPAGTMVLVEGTHTCQCWRGVKKNGSMVTSAIGGVFRTDPAARGEVLALFKS
jgi:GTP cyclohydrolase I